MITTEEQVARKSTKGAAVASHPTTEQIAIRAHEIFAQRGGEPGHDMDDWLQAERELSENGNG